MSVVTEKLRFLFEAVGAKGVAGDLDKIGSSAEKNIGGKLQGGIAKLSSSSALLAGVAGGALVAFGKKTIDAASNLAETQSKVNEVFGSSAESIHKWARGASDDFGMSMRAAEDAAATFAIFGKSAGKSGEDLAVFAQSLTELASDFASFFGGTTAEAAESIGAALRGEAEPIRKYGILLDDATLKQRALTLGIYEGKGALTQQQKVLAAQAEILAQAGDAAGDFDRTSEGLANTQRKLTGAIEDLEAKAGQILLPLMTDVAHVMVEAAEAAGPLADLLQRLQKYGNAKSEKNGLLDNLRTLTLGNFGSLFKGLKRNFDGLFGNTEDDAEEAGAAAAAAYMRGWTAPHPWQTASATPTSTAQLGGVFDEMLDGFNKFDRQARDRIAGIFGDMTGAAMHTANAVSAIGREWDELTGKFTDDDAWLSLQDTFAATADAVLKAFDKKHTQQDVRDAGHAVNNLKLEVIDYANTVLGLPPTMATTIVAKLDYLSYEDVQRQLAILTRNRTMNIDIQSRGGIGYTGRNGGDPDAPQAGNVATGRQIETDLNAWKRVSGQTAG